MKCIIKNYNGLKNIICAIILIAAVSCSEGNISMIDELPVEKDLVGIPVQHDMLGVVDIKAIDTLLVAAVMDGRDGFWKFCRLQDMSVVYSCFRKGNGPYEYVSAPWLYNQQFISGNGNSQCMIYDFTRGGIKVLDIGRTLSTKTTAAQDSDYKLPGGLFGWRYLGDGTFIIKEVDERHTREERYLLSGSDMKKIDIEGLNDLAVAAGNDINIIGTTIGSNGDGSIVAEACTHLNNLYLYAPDGSSFKTICIDPHGYDDPAAVMGYKVYQSSQITDLMKANIEALSRGEGGLDARYTRIDQQCRIYVGVRGRIKLLGGTIIKADGEGYVAFDGHVICGGGGNFACTPVECKELYEVITR